MYRPEGKQGSAMGGISDGTGRMALLYLIYKVDCTSFSGCFHGNVLYRSSDRLCHFLTSTFWKKCTSVHLDLP